MVFLPGQTTRTPSARTIGNTQGEGYRDRKRPCNFAGYWPQKVFAGHRNEYVISVYIRTRRLLLHICIRLRNPTQPEELTWHAQPFSQIKTTPKINISTKRNHPIETPHFQIISTSVRTSVSPDQATPRHTKIPPQHEPQSRTSSSPLPQRPTTSPSLLPQPRTLSSNPQPQVQTRHSSTSPPTPVPQSPRVCVCVCTDRMPQQRVLERQPRPKSTGCERVQWTADALLPATAAASVYTLSGSMLQYVSA